MSDLLNYTDSLSPEEHAYTQAMLKNWFTPKSGFNVNDPDLLNYFARLDKRSPAQAFLGDNTIGLVGSLGWKIHPLVGAIVSTAGMLESATNSRRNYLWDLYKKVTNNGTKPITQEEFEAQYQAENAARLAAKDAAIAGVVDLASNVSPATRIGRIATRNIPLKAVLNKTGRKTITNFGTGLGTTTLQNMTTNYDDDDDDDEV